MSIKIRLNNKRFLGESLLIGSRLNEEGEVQQPASNSQAAVPVNGQTAGQSAAQQQQTVPANGQTTTPNAVPTNTANTQNANGQGQNSQGGVAQQLQQVYIKHFQGLQAAIANDLKTIQGVQWAQNVQPKDQSFNSIMAALQEYMKANVEAAKKAVEASAQQGQAANIQNASANASVGQ